MIADTLYWVVVKAGALVALVLAIFAVRVAVTFDWNRYRERRRKEEKERLKMLCPHVYITMRGGQVSVRLTITSPYGTTQWVCG